MAQPHLVIGSRGSKLALWQSEWVKARLAEGGTAAEITIIHTKGDKILDVALSKVGGKGLFTKELEEALLEGTIDLAVHSLKDMPTELPEGLQLTAIPEREDARDAMVGLRLEQLPKGARVGTSSLRRAAQLRRLRPDLELLDIRGNVDTRLRKLHEGQYDAIVLAAAGLKRLGLESEIAELLPVTVMTPAPGQGALAVETTHETKASSERAIAAVGRLMDPTTQSRVLAERTTLAAMGGGCQVPLGAHAWLEEGQLQMRGVCVSPDGSLFVEATGSAKPEEALALGQRIADQLLGQGADRILQQVYGE